MGKCFVCVSIYIYIYIRNRILHCCIWCNVNTIPAVYCIDSHGKCYQNSKTWGLYLEFLPWLRIVAIMNSCSWMWVEPSSTGNWRTCEISKSIQENWDVIEWKLWRVFCWRICYKLKLQQLTQNYWVEIPFGVFSCNPLIQERFLASHSTQAPVLFLNQGNGAASW